MAGNKNSGRRKSERQFADALRLAIRSSNGESLRRMISALIAEAEGGNIQALKEVADRLDGKVPQPMTHGGDEDNPIVHRIERRIVRTNTGD